MAGLISSGLYHFVMGSRILGGRALSGGMPFYKYVSNRLLTAVQNILFGAKLSEYHTGYRAYSKKLLEKMDFSGMSDDFVFDNEFIAQALWRGYEIGEISCPTKYFAEASSISFLRSVKYGIGCLRVGVLYSFSRWLRLKPPSFLSTGR